MRKISARRAVLLFGVATLVSCAPPHVIDDDPAAAPGTEEREPAEPDDREPAEPDDDAPDSDEPGL